MRMGTVGIGPMTFCMSRRRSNQLSYAPESEVIRTIKSGEDLSRYIQSEKSSAGRGGMASKYKTASNVAAAGIKVIIANGNRENILKDLAERPSETIHTEFSGN